jgi:hypothetical protein
MQLSRASRRFSFACSLTPWFASMVAPIVVACGSSDPEPGKSHGVEASAALPAVSTLASALRAPAAAPDSASGSLALTLIAPARPVTTSDERRHLVYEFILQNTSDQPQRISELEVFESGRRRPLLSISGEALQEVVLGGDPVSGSIEPGNTAFAFIDLELDPSGRLPQRLRHRVRTEAGDVLAGPSVPVIRGAPLRVAPPLRGGNLVDVGGCCRGEHGHAVLVNETGAFVGQRYAIDFLRVEGTSSFARDPSDNENYFIFGDEVLAAGRGRVVATRDGMPENDPTQPLPPFTVETAAGNYVVEDLGTGHFALYAHLQTGSVRVQPGDRLRQGQVLGLVGNTGNSTEPHLHFQVTDGPEPLFSQGLPYVFERFQLQARVDVSGDEAVIVPEPEPRLIENRLPLELDIVAFPGAQ